MALMGCLGCEGTYEIGVSQCPHCGTRSPMVVGGEDMPKATSGGASNAWESPDVVDEPVAVEPVEAAEVPADAETVKMVGEHGPEPELPEGVVMLGADDAHGLEGLTLLRAAPSSEMPAVDVTAMTKAELQGHADSLGLPTSGSKADLAARITDHVESQGSGEAANAEPEVQA